MLTQAQIAAEEFTTPLTPDQELSLTMLVRQYENYANNTGLWPNFVQVLNAEVVTPTIKTQGLKAVLTQLNLIPAYVVESNKNQTFFSTKTNWNILAQDVLDILYENVLGMGGIAGPMGSQMFAVAQHPVQDITIVDNMILPEESTGRRW